MKIRSLMMGSVALVLASSAFGQEPTAARREEDKARPVEKITVTATRQKRKVDEVPATVSVITDKEIEDALATDIKDVIRFEPGVSVRTNPVRFSAAQSGVGRDGNSGFNIRGIEGNRVLIQIDGIRVPDAFSFGPQVVGRGDYLDLDIVKSIEILRGPASALYGSDGLAGAVSFITKDPDDFLEEGQFFGARARVSYASADNSWSEGAVAATQTEGGEWQGMLAYNRRDANETENQGKNYSLNASRTAPNPSDIESDNIFAKLVYAPDDQNRVRLTYEYYDRFMTTEAYSARSATVIDIDGEDETTRNRMSLDYRFGGGTGFISTASAALYYQTAETREFTYEDRNPAVDRTREGLFDNAVWGAVAEFTSDFDIHSFVYGFDYSVTRSENIRTGTVPTPPDFFPTKAFPDTEFMNFGAFIQDEISLFDGMLRFYPALRFDAYEIKPELSPLYPLPTAPGSSDSHITPKFGAIFWAQEQIGFFANYAEGFKAPAPSQVNNGFTNAAQDYTSIPNPNLKPEVSETIEGGVRVRDVEVPWGGELAASATLFRGEYTDFIDQVCVNDLTVQPLGCVIDFNPATGTTTFQYINLTSVTIDGFETRVDVKWPSGVGFTGALSVTEGSQNNNGASAPLSTIDPLKMVLGLRYDDNGGLFGGQAVVTYSDNKDPLDVALGTCVNAAGAPVPCFTPKGFAILDITAYVNITDYATLRVGVFNVFDEKYAWWNDVRSVPATSTVTDAYTQPGANASASLVVKF